MKHHQLAGQLGGPLRVRQTLLPCARVRVAAVHDNHLHGIAGGDDRAVVFHRSRREQIRRERTRCDAWAGAVDHGHVRSAAPLQAADDATGLEAGRTGHGTVFDNGK